MGIYFAAAKNGQIGCFRVNSHAPAGECACHIEIITAIDDCELDFRVRVERQHGSTSLLPRGSRSCSLNLVSKHGKAELRLILDQPLAHEGLGRCVSLADAKAPLPVRPESLTVVAQGAQP